MKNLAIVGARGRMGREVREAAEGVFDVVGLIVESDPDGDLEFQSLDDVERPIDVVIDFSAPTACVAAAKWCSEHSVPFVSGTTGLTDAQLASIESASSETPVLLASNFSVGVNVLERLVELASRSMRDWDAEVFEAHHRRKVDAPSGTALTLGEAAARGRDVDLDDVATWIRHGQTGPREVGEIGFQVVRGGSIVGEHTVFFCGNGERVELTHRAGDRSIFARGAVRAAGWLVGKPAARYQMSDVLFSD